MTNVPTATARRLRGVLLAALLCASQLGAWVHETVVSHVTCLEHGEAIHADASAYPFLGVPPTAEPLSRVSGWPAARQGHEHCGGGALVRWGDVVLAAPLANGQLPLASLSAPTRDGSRDPILGRGLYLVAPKTSPPSPGA